MNLLSRFFVVWRASLRPARWLFAAAVGVVAALSVPLVAAGTPSAAHRSHVTVSQSFASQPSVAEGATNAQGERLLAGDDRYETAVLLAEVSLAAGDTSAGSVVVVSGESLVDAVSAVSLAASRDATVVLTRAGGLPDTLASFVTDRGFSSATIGGGTAAVSAAAERELAALVPTGAASTERVEGATRYETAVHAARAAGDPGVWCDGRAAAVLVSGTSLVDGVIAAPVAYAMGLPLLFTRADALPEAVAKYLAEASIERAIIVGSPAEVAGAVLADLGDAGVATVAFDAPTPAARSVELAEAMADCAAQPTAAGEYALLDASQPVDGVAAAAALATGLGSHSPSDDLIPILAVNQSTLPQPVAAYLTRAGRVHDQVTLYPLGGTARITPSVVTRAVAAAQGHPDTADDNVDAGVDAGDGAAGLPEFAATVDLDGDGVLSFDELYPADTPHRDAYLAVSGGVAPPGAFAPPVPDLAAVRGDPRRSELSLGRTSHDRFPNGFPLPPGAPDYATTTFDERQQLRADAYAAYAEPDPSLGAPRNTARGQWDDMYALSCKIQMADRERNNGRAPGGFETFPCEWLTDWSIWQCDVLNDPAVTRLAPHEQWIELTVRYYDLWVDLVGRDRFHTATLEVTNPSGWSLWGVQYRFRGFWEGTTYVGRPFCSFRLDSEPSQANETFHNQQVTLLRDYFEARTGSAISVRAARDYIFEHVWLPRNRWYLDDVCSVDSTRCPAQTRSG